ncbi:MAG: Rossmann-fold NAD(P)-binding domain-containing protein, partial [Planctomycetota bacterium]
TIVAVGDGPSPRAFDRFLAGTTPRVTYTRVDLARHRTVSDLFHSSRLREAEIDTVIHLPRHGAAAAAAAPIVAGLAERTAEARLVLQNCLETPSVRNLVAIGSAFVYRLPPGNANRLHEDSELDLDPDVTPEIRSWIDCDMIFHGEVHNDRLRVVLLRVPTVVASGGYVYLNPSLSGRPGWRVRNMGFDPLCALVADKDVARAVQAALRSPHPGIYNIAGNESMPFSVLARWTGRQTVPLPATLMNWVSTGARLLGRDAPTTGRAEPHLSFGFTLDTTRAERDLAFRPASRIGLARAGDGALRLETASL